MKGKAYFIVWHRNLWPLSPVFSRALFVNLVFTAISVLISQKMKIFCFLKQKRGGGKKADIIYMDRCVIRQWLIQTCKSLNKTLLCTQTQQISTFTVGTLSACPLACCRKKEMLL